MGKLFLLVKWYVKEIISFQSIWILVIVFYKELNTLTQFLFKYNNQWKFQRNLLWFKGCCSTVFKLYIIEWLQLFVSPTYLVPFSTFPVNMYIKYSSLWILPITPKYHPILFKKIEIHKPFTSDIFQLISVNSMKRTDQFLFITGYLIFII